jgi:hypothetical protein
METKIVHVVPGAAIRFRVEAVDCRMRLFSDGVLRYSATSQDPLPASFPLEVETTYWPVFDNNDGGPGFVKIAVEQRLAGAWEPAGYFIDLGGMSDPVVIEFPPFLCRAP